MYKKNLIHTKLVILEAPVMRIMQTQTNEKYQALINSLMRSIDPFLMLQSFMKKLIISKLM
jgi:hypothetical protein